MSFKIKFCGAAGTVTGSTHLVVSDHSNVLIDCGLFQGHREDFFNINSNFLFDPSAINACVLSHSHIDHSGNIPNLIKQGFPNKIYCTRATRDLCKSMLPDSGHIQEEDIKYLNKIHRRKGLPQRSPLYTQADARAAIKHFRAVDYHKSIKIGTNMHLEFYDAGHILGSSIPVIEMEGRKGKVRLACAADLGREGMPFLIDPEIPPNVDHLIIESTYGGRRHRKKDDAEDVLVDTINRTIRRGGKVIIPSFALERTQDLLYYLTKIMHQKRIKRIPIYVDSPLAMDITKVFQGHWETFDEEFKELFTHGRQLFEHDCISYLRHSAQSKSLNDKTGPMIIISASGMCESGRILHHLKNNIENRNNTIMIVGYMAKNTLGRRISEGKKTVNIFGRPYTPRAEVVQVNFFSTHADKVDLLKFIKGCRPRLKSVFIVHGEPDESDALRKSVKSIGIKVRVPKRGEVFSV